MALSHHDDVSAHLSEERSRRSSHCSGDAGNNDAVVNVFSRSVAGAEAETFEHRGMALSPAPVWYAQAGAAVCGAEVFDDFIGLAFQRGISATQPAGGVAGCFFNGVMESRRRRRRSGTRGRASQTATPRGHR